MTLINKYGFGFMSLEMLVLLQLCVALLIGAVILVLILRRQKQTIQKLQDILFDVKDELSGEALLKHLQLEIDNTTAHCRQQTIALTGDLSEEDLAITLRFNALSSELDLAKSLGGEKKLPWRDHIKGYMDLVSEINRFNNERIENSARILNEVHQEELDIKNSTIEALNAEKLKLSQQVEDLKPLQNFIKLSTDSNNSSRIELEQAMHKALLSLCENFPNSEDLRELVFLIHESFNESETVKQLIIKESESLKELDALEDQIGSEPETAGRSSEISS